VLTRNALKSLTQRLTIKNIVAMNAAELQPTKRLWKSIMKKRLLDLGLKENVRFVSLG